MTDDNLLPFSLSDYEPSGPVYRGPLGTLAPKKHIPSREIRSLKIIHAELSARKEFEIWYVLQLHLSRFVAEQMRIPGLIVPNLLRNGKEWAIVDGTLITERPYLDALNVDQFIEKYSGSDPAGGVPEPVALAILSMIVESLDRMHKARVQRPDGPSMLGIPHRNLKPANVFIGQDPRSQAWQIYLTDFLIATSSPLGEKYGIAASLQYTCREALEDDAYFGTYGDIYSSGLLLYKLMQGKDLVPTGLRRESAVSFIRNEMPNLMTSLNLKKGKGSSTRNIIIKCLTAQVAERYNSAEQLLGDLQKALKLHTPKSPADVVKDFVTGPPPKSKPALKAAPEKTGPSPLSQLSDWFGKNWKIAAMAGGGLVAVIAAIWFFQNMQAENARKKQEAWVAQVDLVRGTVAQFSPACAVADFKSNCEAHLTAADNLHATGQEAEAQRSIDELSTLIATASAACVRWQSVSAGFWNAIPEELRIDSAFIGLNARVETLLYEVQGAFGKLDFQAVEQRLGELERLTDSLRPPLQPVDSQPDPELPVCEGQLPQLEQLVSNLSAKCLTEARRLLANARQACSERDQIGFEQIRTSLQEMTTRADCQPGATTTSPSPTTTNPVVTPPPVVSTPIATVDSLARLRDSATSLLAGADKGLAEFEARYRGRDLSTVFCYVQSRKYRDQARERLNKSEYRLAIQNVTTSMSSLQGCEVPADTSIAKPAITTPTVKPPTPTTPPVVTKPATPAVVPGATTTPVTPTTASSLKCCKELQALRDSAAQKLLKCNSQTQDLTKVMEYAEQYLKSCDCKGARTELNRIIADKCGEDACPAGDCIKAVQSGDIKAWECCRRVKQQDPDFPLTQKYYIVALARAGKFTAPDRRAMIDAFRQAGTVIDASCTNENVTVRLSLAWCYAADTLNIDYQKARSFFDDAQQCGDGAKENELWWRGLLVSARCAFKKWKDTKSPVDRSDARSKAQNFLEYTNQRAASIGIPLTAYEDEARRMVQATRN